MEAEKYGPNAHEEEYKDLHFHEALYWATITLTSACTRAPARAFFCNAFVFGTFGETEKNDRSPLKNTRTR
jgi:hypothetical protein